MKLILSAINNFKEKVIPEIEKKREINKMVIEKCDYLRRTWSGSFSGWHANMYYNSFKVPELRFKFSPEWGGIHGIPEGWSEKQTEEVLSELEKLVGRDFNFITYELEVKKLYDEVKELKIELLVQLSIIDFDDKKYEKEKEIYKDIESFIFGKSRNSFIHARLPSQLISRDTEAIMQGMVTPTWLLYQGIAFEGESICDDVERFIQISERLIKQIELKERTVENGTKRKDKTIYNHKKILAGIIIGFFIAILIICIMSIMIDKGDGNLFDKVMKYKEINLILLIAVSSIITLLISFNDVVELLKEMLTHFKTK